MAERGVSALVLAGVGVAAAWQTGKTIAQLRLQPQLCGYGVNCAGTA
jgi:hypothetical protein